MEDYHPIAAAWLAAIATHKRVAKRLGPLSFDTNFPKSHQDEGYFTSLHYWLSDLQLGTISSEFLDSINSSSKSEGARIFNASFDTYIKGCMNSDNFLDVQVNVPHLNKAFITLLFCCIFHAAPLDEDTELLNQRISILNFLPPPKPGNDGDCKSHITRSKSSFMEWDIEESSEKRSAINKHPRFVGVRPGARFKASINTQ